MEVVICPLARTLEHNPPCLLNSCGMYDGENKQCAVVTIAQKEKKTPQTKK